MHTNAIASIASIASLEIPGVHRIGKSLKAKIIELVKDKGYSDISVQISKNDEVSVDIPLFIKFGFNVPDIAAKVQENVRASLEKMTSLSVKDININVLGIERG